MVYTTLVSAPSWDQAPSYASLPIAEAEQSGMWYRQTGYLAPPPSPYAAAAPLQTFGSAISATTKFVFVGSMRVATVYVYRTTSARFGGLPGNEDGYNYIFAIKRPVGYYAVNAVTQFGDSVSVGPSGEVLAVGDPVDKSVQLEGGAVYIYTKVRYFDRWTFHQKLLPAVGLRYFGEAVAVRPTDDVIVTSHRVLDGLFVYRYSAATEDWSQHSVFVPNVTSYPGLLTPSALSVFYDFVAVGLPPAYPAVTGSRG